MWIHSLTRPNFSWFQSYITLRSTFLYFVTWVYWRAEWTSSCKTFRHVSYLPLHFLNKVSLCDILMGLELNWKNNSIMKWLESIKIWLLLEIACDFFLRLSIIWSGPEAHNRKAGFQKMHCQFTFWIERLHWKEMTSRPVALQLSLHRLHLSVLKIL